MQALTDTILVFLQHHGTLIASLVVFLILFSETGLLIGFFLPGDSLLIALGILAPSAHLSLIILTLAAALGAIVGNTTGYAIGHWAGPELLQSKWAKVLQPYVDEAHTYFDRYGKSTLIITRFTPVIRTFVPTIAGISRMDYRIFTIYNIFGGLLWSFAIVWGGYFLSKSIPGLATHITAIEAVILVVSLLVAGRHIMTLTRQK